MAEPKKIMFRKIRRNPVTGDLELVFVDIKTGNVLTDTTGYTTISGGDTNTSDGGNGFLPPADPAPAPATPAPAIPRTSNDDEGGQHGDSDSDPWSTGGRPLGELRPAKPIFDTNAMMFDFLGKKVNEVNPLGKIQETASNATGGLLGAGGIVGNIFRDLLTEKDQKPRNAPVPLDKPAGVQNRPQATSLPATPQTPASDAPTARNEGLRLPNGTIEGTGGPKADHIQYSDDIATRTLPVSGTFKQLSGAASYATSKTIGKEVTLHITSGGQPPTERDAKGNIIGVKSITDSSGFVHDEAIGTTRHEEGVAEFGVSDTADFYLVVDGKPVTTNSHPEVYKEFAKNSAAVGFTGIGVYKGGFIHVGMGDPAFWNGTGKDDGAPKPIFDKILEGFEEGKALEQKGVGAQIVGEYLTVTNQVPTPAVRSHYDPLSSIQAPKAAAVPEGVDPKLANILDNLKAKAPPTAITLASATSALGSFSTKDIGKGVPIKAFDPLSGIQVPTNKTPAQQFDPLSGIQVPNTSMNQEMGAGGDIGVPGFLEKLASQQQPSINTFQPVNANVPMPRTDPRDPKTLNMSSNSDKASLATPDNIDAVKGAYLDALAFAEGGEYDITFGGGKFDLTQGRPDFYNKEFNTTASGRYQFNDATWNEWAPKAGVDVRDFSPAAQDKVAWTLAEANYNARTNRDLYQDLISGDREKVFAGNANRWASLPSGSQQRTEFDELAKVFDQSVATRTASLSTGVSDFSPKTSKPFVPSNPDFFGPKTTSARTSDKNGFMSSRDRIDPVSTGKNPTFNDVKSFGSSSSSKTNSSDKIDSVGKMPSFSGVSSFASAGSKTAKTGTASIPRNDKFQNSSSSSDRSSSSGGGLFSDGRSSSSVGGTKTDRPSTGLGGSSSGSRTSSSSSSRSSDKNSSSRSDSVGSMPSFREVSSFGSSSSSKSSSSSSRMNKGMF